VPLAYFTVRFDFRGALLIQTLGVLPLIMPPFVGAVALQLIFGRSGQRQPAAATSTSASRCPSWTGSTA
jgi:ABC-type Fe3+ transport system permease subunit